MRKASILLIFIMLLFAVSTAHDLPYIPVTRPDIVMIDTGTTVGYSGFMRMERSCKNQCWHVHGDLMAKALNDEISGLNFDREINVHHLVWDGSTSSIPRLIDQAVALNPKVITMSLAGDDIVVEEYVAIKRASAKNIIVMAASGNTNGTQPQFPAGYDAPCLVAVSTKEFGVRVATANLGEIYLERMSGEKGTSFSTARSAALALKLFEKYGDISCMTAKNLLIREFGSAQ